MNELINVAVEAFPLLMEGLKVTIFLTLLSVVLGFVIGVLVALGRVYGNKPIYWLTTAFVELIRGTPLLVQLFILYYGLPPIGIRLAPLTAAVLGFAINSGAYQAEYLRGSINSIEDNQMKAGRSLGMTRWQTVFYIILPQALRRVIPSWTNEFIYLLKYTSLAYIIDAPELMAQAKFAASRNYQFFNIYLITGLIYLAVVLIFSTLFKGLERKFKIPT